jgi:hypothetical protein
MPVRRRRLNRGPLHIPPLAISGGEGRKSKEVEIFAAWQSGSSRAESWRVPKQRGRVDPPAESGGAGKGTEIGMLAKHLAPAGVLAPAISSDRRLVDPCGSDHVRSMAEALIHYLMKALWRFCWKFGGPVICGHHG